MVPFPDPLVADVSWMKGVATTTLELHLQPGGAVMAIVPVPPVRGKFWRVGEMEYVQGGGGADGNPIVT